MDKKTLNLSKKLIMNLPIFMDTAVETLTSFTGLEAKKLTHEIKTFNTALAGDYISAIMKFRGNIDGSFVLIFPSDIAKMTIESLLSEKVDSKDFDTLKDGVGEFCNIIMGSIKTTLLKQKIKITFTLPKTYISLKRTQAVIGEENGVWVNMSLSKMQFYMFITKAIS